MPPLIIIAAAGAGLFAGYRLFSRLITQAATPNRLDAERLRQQKEAALARAKDLGELKWDEEKQVYRPRGQA